MPAVPFYYKDDLEYANKRLSNTYVLDTAGNLLFVTGFNLRPVTKSLVQLTATCLQFNKSTVLSMDLPSYGLPSVEIPSNQLNMEPLSLGWVFSKRLGKATYLCRYPARTAYKQGLFMGAISFSEGGKNDITPVELLAPVFNNYPTLTEALHRATQGSTTVPFSRHFAVNHKREVFYRGRQVVGKVVESFTKQVVSLSPAYSYLQQHLDWSLK